MGSLRAERSAPEKGKGRLGRSLGRIKMQKPFEEQARAQRQEVMGEATRRKTNRDHTDVGNRQLKRRMEDGPMTSAEQPALERELILEPEPVHCLERVLGMGDDMATRRQGLAKMLNHGVGNLQG